MQTNATSNTTTTSTEPPPQPPTSTVSASTTTHAPSNNNNKIPHLCDMNDIDQNRMIDYMIEKKYIDEIYTMKQYLKMFHCMFPNHGDEKTEVVAPRVDLIVSEDNECSATRIPRAPQAGGKWTSSTAKKPGRKQEKRLIASGKTKKDL